MTAGEVVAAHHASDSADVWQVQRYEHEQHAEHVKEMCADVYGGKDYMPRLLDDFAGMPHVLMLVAMRAADSHVGGIICVERRGSVLFVFGLRVCSKLRGRGIARTLVHAAGIEAPAALPGAHAIMTVTIEANKAAVTLFSRAMCQEPMHVAHAWPPWSATYEYEACIGWPARSATPADSVLQAVPGALDLLQGDTAAARQLPLWRRASSLDELVYAVGSVRGKPVGAGGAPGHAVQDAWLPGMYEVQPLDGEVVQDALSQGRVWVLPAAAAADTASSADLASGAPGSEARAEEGGSHCSSSGSSGSGVQYVGALLLFKSREARRMILGLLVAEPSAFHSGLLLAAGTLLPGSPHFVSFVECARGCAQPSVFDLGGGTASDIPRWVTYGRVLAKP